MINRIIEFIYFFIDRNVVLRIDLSRLDEVYYKSQFDNIQEILCIVMRHCIKNHTMLII
jgi:hypothetical protein